MPPEVAEIVVWVSGGSSALALGTTVWNLLMSGSRANGRRIDAVESAAAERHSQIEERFRQGSRRMDDLTRRTDALEGTVRQLPGKDDIHAVQLEMAKISGALGEMRAVMDGSNKIMARLEAIVSRHEDHLLDGSKR
ncbi:hypothetical protein RGUI_0825 [Rhodovulum sp. P5]|uniref:DUF2730 family protein n=1 Tax=Rhodovulum phage vB_RhkS_P1 TaxID=1873452 RepID=UPI00080AACFE|nr:DUF2730 family protein [Rhodovulum sp. P5]YP_009285910.1 DUF2730 family protein [Rhodovulum phage vB_RhkS_P1]ANT39895.1 hypothetical protein Rhks_25 [Rhodovulum phage vB_RhkS_P1]ARE38966.1 hypothetical protein RGUI_0825 [Rhodovulum sp. P5]